VRSLLVVLSAPRLNDPAGIFDAERAGAARHLPASETALPRLQEPKSVQQIDLRPPGLPGRETVDEQGLRAKDPQRRATAAQSHRLGFRLEAASGELEEHPTLLVHPVSPSADEVVEHEGLRLHPETVPQ